MMIKDRANSSFLKQKLFQIATTNFGKSREKKGTLFYQNHI